MASQKVAIVTGTSSGVGLDLTLALAAAGWVVHASVREKSKAADLVKLAAEKKVENNVKIFELDVASPNSHEVIEKLVVGVGRVDLLVNNAGFGVSGAVETLTDGDMHKQFETNVFGLVRVTQGVLRTMRAQKTGLVINISSLVGIIAPAFFGIYSASKFALEALTQSLAQEVAPFGVKVVCVEPGFTKSNFPAAVKRTSRQLPGDPYQEAYGQNLAYISKMAASAPEASVVTQTILQVINTNAVQYRYQCTAQDAQLAASILVKPTSMSLPPPPPTGNVQ